MRNNKNTDDNSNSNSNGDSSNNTATMTSTTSTSGSTSTTSNPYTTIAVTSSDLLKELAQGNWSTVMDMVSAKPVLAKSLGSTGGLVLHEALTLQAPYQVIEVILNAYPKAVSIREQVMQQFPLHLACSKYMPVDDHIVSLLLQSSMEEASDADRMGRVPLHYALEHACSIPVVKYLLGVSPNVTKAQDIHGATPLHMACKFQHATIVIGALLELYPESCIMVMENGATATTIVNETKAPNQKEVIMLLNQYQYGFDQKFRMATQPSSRRLLV